MLGWGRVRDALRALGAPARAAAGIVTAVVLAAALGAQAAGSGREAAALGRRAAALDRELERARGRNRALREELRALDEDPVYLETLLRRWRRAGEGERVVE
jgi:hypothetical protein